MSDRVTRVEASFITYHVRNAILDSEDVSAVGAEHLSFHDVNLRSERSDESVSAKSISLRLVSSPRAAHDVRP